MSIVIEKEMTATAMKNLARKDVIDLIFPKVYEIYGEENVTQTKAGELAVCVGYTPNGEELCVTLTATAKNPVPTTGKKPTAAFDREAEGKKYEAAVEKAEQKKAESAARKKQ